MSELLDVLSRLAGVPRASVDVTLPVRDLLAAMPLPAMALPEMSTDDVDAPFAGATQDVPEEVRLFLVAAAIEDACGVDLTEHPEFESLWLGPVARLIELAETTASSHEGRECP